MSDEETAEREQQPEPADQAEEPGAEGGSESPEADRLPMTPAPGADSALGDTDQHSDA